VKTLRKVFTILVTLSILLSSCSIPLKTGGDGISIHDIQGCAHESPFLHMSVSDIQGVVTWKVDNGFYMQELNPDNRDCSSEGIFVFTEQYPDVIPGDLVSVEGRVDEFTPGNIEEGNLSVTEIDMGSIQLIKTNVDLPQPVVIGHDGRTPPSTVIDDDRLSSFDIDADGIDFYESLEGMRIQVNEALAVESTNAYNEVFVIPSELGKENLISRLGALIQAQVDSNPERILLQMPDGYTKYIRQGQYSDAEIIGVMGYEFGNYRILVTSQPAFSGEPENQASYLSELDENQIRLVTYNINNFNRFDDEKLSDLTEQIVTDLRLPDIMILQEVQDDSGSDDDGTTSASKNLDALVNSIYHESDVLYRYFDPEPRNNSSGGARGANIRTVILCRKDRGLTYLGQYDKSFTNGQAFENSRAPVINQFSMKGKELFVIGVHLVSNNLNTPLFGAIQPIKKPEEYKRIEQGMAIANLVKTIQADSPEAWIIVAGDFNDTTWSDTLDQLSTIGMTNITGLVNETERYSILYEGNANLFDHILVSQSLQQQVTGIEILHINTPNPEDKQVSDHDPVILEFQF